ncbi:MAG: YceI family protein [Gemmatimonadaceae bacterium]
MSRSSPCSAACSLVRLGRVVTRAIALGITVASIGVPSLHAQPPAPPLPRRFNIDASHSSVGFAVKFMGLSTVRGAFADVAGTIMYAEGDLTRSTVNVIIDVASINTNSRTRDQHLRSPDFFDAAKYPTITFRSTRITRTPAGLAVRGTFTMHGVTKELDVPFVQLNAPVPDAWGNSRATFQGGLRVSRKEYGIKGTAFWNGEFDPGRMAVSDDVDIELLVSANVPNPLRWTHPMGDSLLASVEADGVADAVRRFKGAYAGSPRVDSVPEFAFVLVGEKLAAKGRAADAITFYEGILETRPAAGAVRQLLGEAYVKTGQLARARREFERVVREFPESTAAAEWLRVLPAT